MNKIFCLLLLVLIGIVSLVNAQSEYIIKGRVVDEKGEALFGIGVGVEGSAQGVATGFDGGFTISTKHKGPYIVVISGIGYETVKLEVKDFNKPISVVLKANTTELQEVEVVGKSEITLVRELPFAVSVIDVKPLQILNLDVNQVLGTVSGVRIREEGGLGSGFNFSLNGFTGKQVKFFMDGIPMESFGSSLSLNNIPVNLISGIEVYKGVVPVHLGADALGGAVNVLTNHNVKNYVNASYSLGSFNTHRASVLSQFTESRTGLTFNANLFYNYSDNNYWMKGVDTVDVRRFHDAYQSQTVQLEMGFVNKPFADRLLIGFTSSGNQKEVQTGINFQQVFGGVIRTDKVLMPSIKYKKNNFFVQGLDVSTFAIYNHAKSESVDTSSMKYDWYGNATRRTNNAGEFSYNKSLFSFNDGYTLANGNISYKLGQAHSFSINHNYTRFTRVGRDPLRSSNEIQFKEPNVLIKNVTGLSYSLNLFEGKWKSTVFAKIFSAKRETLFENDTTGTFEEYSISSIDKGLGFATTYFITNWAQVKLSYENTYRLPEGEELFGNGLSVLPNTNLKPENSSNYNLGLMLNKSLGEHLLQFEAQYLFRQAKDLIWQAPGPQFSIYSNLDDANLTSYEAGARYKYKDMLDVQFNLTKQKNINTSKEDPRYLDDLPNQPFFFWNGSIGLNKKKVGFKNNSLSVSWFTQYIGMFYWKWPSQGTKKDKFDIPTQFSQDLMVSYSMVNGRYNASFACTNLTDALRFDNFALQKPGRAFSLKLSYYFTY